MAQCIFCAHTAKAATMADRPRVIVIDCTICGPYAITDVHQQMIAHEYQHKGTELTRMAALLFERRLQGHTAPIIYIGNEVPPEEIGFAALTPNDILSRWPADVAEAMDRCLAIVCRLSRVPGDVIRFQPPNVNRFLFLSSVEAERAFYRSSLAQLGHVDVRQSREGVQDVFGISVTASGWKRFGDLQREIGSRANPVFVAMWFGGAQLADRQRMTSFYEQSIKGICNGLGWLAERVDSEEHNESIMDRIFAMIRQAPFVIAELSHSNRGVYYEAGFARGLGREVIYLVQDVTATDVHFDLSGVNHLRWTAEEDLRKKLENRILGTMGRGPHKAAN